MANSCLVIHIGAGNHSKKKNKLYKALLKKSLQTDTLLHASQIVERSLLTNTGYGASLNLNKEVKCDASYLKIENGQIRGGSMYNINTIFPITSLLDGLLNLDKLYRDGNNTFGLSKPVMLDYDSLKVLDNILGNEIQEKGEVNPVLPIAAKFYDKYRPFLFNSQSSSELIRFQDNVTDTIGIISINENVTEIASSSGGNFFKLPGRIGCAGIIGASTDFITRQGMEISCICSGTGEHIIETKLANFLIHNICLNDEDNRISLLIKSLKLFSANLFLHSASQENLKQERIFYVGAIITLRNSITGRIQILYIHSTESFYFGFKSSKLDSEVVFSRLNKNAKPGIDFAYGEFVIN